MILFSAALGVVPPLPAARPAEQRASPGARTSTPTPLDLLVAGMVAIPIITGAIGVAQTWQSNLVGQQVMHDLRAAVYRHLQRLSLAFFTRTRTGEVQSRIANDIGGVQTRRHHDRDLDRVERDHGRRHVGRDGPARLAARDRGVRAAARVRADDAPDRRRCGARSPSTMQGSLADISTLVEESLSVSGVLLGKDDGPDRRAHRRASSPRAGALADLEQRQRMAGRWVMASIQATFAVMPALDVRRRRLPALDRRRRRSRSAPWSPSRPCRPGSSSRSRRCSACRPTCRRRSRCSTACSSTSTCRSTSTSGPTRSRSTARERARARSSSTTCQLRLRPRRGADARGHLVRRRAGQQGGRRGRDRLGQDHARLPGRAAVRRRLGLGADRRHRRARPHVRLAAQHRRRRLPGDLPVPRHGAREPGLRPARARPTRRSRRRPAPPRSTSTCGRCRRATTPSSASAATASRAARSSGWRSPGRSCATRPCWCWTRPRARSTSRPSGPCRTRSTSSARAARASPSPTGSPPCATPT